MSAHKTSPAMFIHGTAAFAALLVVTFFAIDPTNQLTAQVGMQREEVSVDIGVEHTQPLGLSLEVSTLEGVAIAEIMQDGEETIFLSVPSTWMRREVRNVPIAEVISDDPSFGFTRWHLPAGGGISFRVPHAPDHINLHNPSTAILKVNFTFVDLETEEVIHDVILLREEAVELL